MKGAPWAAGRAAATAETALAAFTKSRRGTSLSCAMQGFLREEVCLQIVTWSFQLSAISYQLSASNPRPQPLAPVFSPARRQESERHNRGAQRARVVTRSVIWRIGLKLGLDGSGRAGRQRPAHGADAQLRQVGGPQRHTVQPRAEIGVPKRCEQLGAYVQNHLELRGPWRAVQTGRGVRRGPAKALFESKPAIRQLPNRRQLVVHNVSRIQRVRIMDYNPKLAVRLRPDERGDGGILFQSLRRGIFNWIHLYVHVRQKIAQGARRSPGRKRGRQAVIEEYRNALEQSGGGAQLRNIVATVGILGQLLAAVVAQIEVAPGQPCCEEYGGQYTIAGIRQRGYGHGHPDQRYVPIRAKETSRQKDQRHEKQHGGRHAEP